MIVFFLRRFNDIDHSVPVIYELLRTGAAPVKVYVVDPFLPIESDFRLEFLRREYSCLVTRLHSAHLPNARYKVVAGGVERLIQLAQHSPSVSMAQTIRAVARRMLGRFVYTGAYGFDWACEFLQRVRATALVVDCTAADKYLGGVLSKAARALELPVVGLPHGMDLFVGDDFTTTRANSKLRLSFGERYAWLDIVVVQSEFVFEKYRRHGVETHKMRVLGSTRFCAPWRKLYWTLLPPNPLPWVDGKLKVVFMDHDPRYRMDKQAIVSSLRAVDALDFVDLIVKPATGHAPLSDSRLARLRVESQVSSVHLIEWADVVLSTVSSIAIEILCQGKVFLYPAYFTENRMVFESYGACWTVRGQDELLAAVAQLHRTPTVRPYAEAAVEAFLAQAVYGGVQERDVLAEHADLLMGAGRKLVTV